MNMDYRPRFIFDISEEQKMRADKLFMTHGIRKVVMSILLDDLLDLIENHGQQVLGLIIDKSVKPSDVLPVMAKVKKEVS